MGNRFVDTEEHQADAHSGTEHHRDPRRGPEFGQFLVPAQRDPAVAAYGETDREDHESARGEHESPAAVRDHGVVEEGRRDIREALRREDAPDDDREREGRRHTEDGAVGFGGPFGGEVERDVLIRRVPRTCRIRCVCEVCRGFGHDLFFRLFTVLRTHVFSHAPMTARSPSARVNPFALLHPSHKPGARQNGGTERPTLS